MPKFTRTISEKLVSVADRVISKIAVTAFTAMEAIRRWTARLWEAHQQRMAERADYGPQLATLISVLVALLQAPAWLAQLVTRLMGVYLASTGSRNQPRVGWGPEIFEREPLW